MIDKFKKYLGLHGWMLRSAYIGALVAFGIVCFQFYVGQTSENERTDAYRHMSDSFAIVDEKFRIFFDKANSIIKNYEAAQRLTAASPLSQNQEVDTDAPGGLDIETSKNVLKFFVEIAGEAFDEVLVAWHHAGEQDSASLFADSLFIPSENPFRSYHDLLSLERIDTVKTQKELYLAAGQIVFIFEKMVSPVSVDLQNRLRIMLAERAELQGKRLENFLLIALGMLAGIAVFVFLPVDVILQRMLKSLSIEKERANEAIASLETEATVRKQQEIELIKHRDQLQQLVDDATAELRFKAEELEQALTKEKALSKMQRQFVSMASHEFRTPLAIIDASAQRLLRRADRLTPEDLAKRVEKIRDAVVRMTHLMESTLNAARMEEGKIEVKIGACDLRRLLPEICTRQRELAKTHTITCELMDMPDAIQADPAAMDQIFTNLLSNAVKYSPNAPEIKVIARQQGDEVVISVRDYGLGIDEEDLPQMFERFFRAKTSTGIVGTGIGLNLVKSLVEMHGGSISMESKKSEGSTFSIHLPIAGPEQVEVTTVEAVSDAIEPSAVEAADEAAEKAA